VARLEGLLVQPLMRRLVMAWLAEDGDDAEGVGAATGIDELLRRGGGPAALWSAASRGEAGFAGYAQLI
jgi:hypothetical protein